MANHKYVGIMHEATIGSSASTPIAYTDIPAGANAILIQAKNANAKVTVDDTTPTATHGFLIVADAVPLVIPMRYRTNLKAIRSASTDVQLTWQFIKE